MVGVLGCGGLDRWRLARELGVEPSVPPSNASTDHDYESLVIEEKSYVIADGKSVEQ